MAITMVKIGRIGKYAVLAAILLSGCKTFGESRLKHRLEECQSIAKRGESFRAVDCYNRILSGNQDSALAWVGKSKLLYDIRQFKEARYSFERAANLPESKRTPESERSECDYLFGTADRHQEFLGRGCLAYPPADR